VLDSGEKIDLAIIEDLGAVAEQPSGKKPAHLSQDSAPLDRENDHVGRA
jgi:hypothetical protein